MKAITSTNEMSQIVLNRHYPKNNKQSMAAFEKSPVSDELEIEASIASPPEVRTVIQTEPKKQKECWAGYYRRAVVIESIITKIWTNETLIEHWNNSWSNPIHKIEDKTLCYS